MNKEHYKNKVISLYLLEDGTYLAACEKNTFYVCKEKLKVFLKKHQILIYGLFFYEEGVFPRKAHYKKANEIDLLELGVMNIKKRITLSDHLTSDHLTKEHKIK